MQRYINVRRGLAWKINQSLQHVERIWAKVSDDPVGATNNATERIIGLTLQDSSQDDAGLQKPTEGLGPIPTSLAFLRGEDGLCDLRKVI